MEQNPASSARSLIRLIETDPLNLPLYCALAKEYESAGAFHKAELTLLRALAIDSLYLDAWVRLGILYSNLGDWGRSADAFERSCLLDSNNPANWIGRAMALIATQDIQRAMEVRETLLARFAERSESHLVAGHISKVRGKAAEAAGFYRRALQLDPHQTEAIFNLVDLSPPDASDAFAGRLEGLRRNPALSPRQATNVLFALARIYERAGEVARAFVLFQEGNAAANADMRNLGNAYDRKQMQKETDEILDLFGPDAFIHPLDPLDLDMRLIFIVGMPRSGTTLVERILGNHSSVCAGGELPFMKDCLAKLLADRRSSGERRPISLESASERRRLSELREYYLDLLFERELEGEYVTDKLPANFSALGLIRVLFPDALIVHCNRDPIATCWSLFSAHFGAHLAYYTSLEDLAHYYSAIYCRLMSYWKRVIGSNIIDVSYEKLVARPEIAIGELLARCGLHVEQACFSDHDPGRPIYTASMQQARQPIYTTSVSRWLAYQDYLGPLIEGLRATG